MLLLFGCVLAPSRAFAQNGERPDIEPSGTQIQLSAALLGGRGIEVGMVTARSVFTREVIVLLDGEPLVRDVDRQARVVLLPGVSLRVFGFERLFGGAAYRGFDVDLGLRAGPGLSFAGNESPEDRNRRFELVLAPFVRITAAQSRRVAWLVELGSTRPALRAGIWLRY